MGPASHSLRMAVPSQCPLPSPPKASASLSPSWMHLTCSWRFRERKCGFSTWRAVVSQARVFSEQPRSIGRTSPSFTAPPQAARVGYIAGRAPTSNFKSAPFLWVPALPSWANSFAMRAEPCLCSRGSKQMPALLTRPRSGARRPASLGAPLGSTASLVGCSPATTQLSSAALHLPPLSPQPRISKTIAMRHRHMGFKLGETLWARWETREQLAESCRQPSPPLQWRVRHRALDVGAASGLGRSCCRCTVDG
mmetsp:Transcript_49151/g.101470  ORF Transcript_49151/g.101470 Transcript_49151/m.101470 type:complete len:252 (-) Transcript_49151:67-822(-)